ncbi:MAG: hypothetical protein PUC30_09670 [Lachnospiraceae bacterium]|nr:hypothetical protein [Lachnospiraceae bacterium]
MTLDEAITSPMTLDEAIAQFKYDAECNRADLDLSYAADNEQIAAWLEELKQYHEIGTIEVLLDMMKDYKETLSDWRKYRKLGTVEELRQAVAFKEHFKDSTISEKTKSVSLDEVFDFIDNTYIGTTDASELKSIIVDTVLAVRGKAIAEFTEKIKEELPKCWFDNEVEELAEKLRAESIKYNVVENPRI